MPNPFETERSFRALQHRLQYPISAGRRLHEICGFLESIQDSRAEYESYVLELAALIPDLLRNESFTGTDPAILLRFHECLSGCARDVPQIQAIQGFSASLETLRREAARTFTLLGEDERALQVWSGPGSTATNLKTDRFSVQVPVVERGLRDGGIGEGIGTLRKIILTPLGTSDSGKDEIHLDVAVFGAEADAESILRNPISASRALLAQSHPHLQRTFLRAQIHFEGEHALHEGSSANLALSLLVYCALLESAMQRDIYQGISSAIMTGAVDESGGVMPVDPASVSSKTEAAFFSPAATLVVPKAQLPDFERSAAHLREAYPRKLLTVFGVSNLQELFFDRRITLHTRVSLARHGIRRLWKWRRPVAAGLILTLGVVVAALLYGPLDKVPTSFKLEGEHLTVLNQYNQVLERIPVGGETVYSFMDPSQQLIQHTPAAIADFDGDGIREIVWIENGRKNDIFYTVLRCKSIGSPDIRWKFTPEWKISFRNNSDVNSSAFRAIQVLVEDFDGDGRTEVLANFRHEAFPGVVAKIDAITGEEISHYLHIGHFTAMKAHDLNGDGLKEILLCGTNNAFRVACFTVLDPRNISGHSPLTREYEVVGYERGREIGYIRIPRTRVGDQYRAVVKSNVCLGLNIHEADSSISIRMLDAFIPADSPGGPLSAMIWVKLGFDLTCRGIVTGDNYDIVYDDLVEKGKIEPIWRFEALEGYERSFLYLQGEEWVGR